MYEQEMCCNFVVGVFDKEVCNEHEFDDLEALCVIPPDDPMISHHVSNENPTAASQSTAPNGASTQPIENDANLEGEREPDIFDNEEYVGVDDKHIYTSITCAQTNFADNVAAVDDDVNAEGGVPLEAQVNDADP
jgi:hypothetical protein